MFTSISSLWKKWVVKYYWIVFPPLCDHPRGIAGNCSFAPGAGLDFIHGYLQYLLLWVIHEQILQGLGHVLKTASWPRLSAGEIRYY